MAELGKVLDDEDIIFNEAVTNTGAVLMQIPRRLPNTAFNTNGAGLGWSGGMALGAKLAAPEPHDGADVRRRRLLFQQSVLDLCGLAAIPAADFLHRARQFRLVGGEAIDAAGVSGRRSQSTDEFEAELAPKVEFTKVAEAFGAYAEKVGDPADVPAAIARCAKEVRGGRAALLHVT